MNRLKKLKIYISLIVFSIIIGITSFVNATATSEVDGWRFHPDGKGYYCTTHNGNNLVFCVELGGPLKDTLPEDLPEFYNNKEYFCNACKDEDWRPAAGKNDEKYGYTSEMSNPEIVDYKEHQDVAYALAFAPAESEQDKVQTVIWKSELDASGGSDEQTIIDSHNGGTHISDEGLAEEAQAYKAFYEEKEKAGGFKPIDATKYEDIKVIADQTDDTYIIGKYNINYTKGIYVDGDRVVKFGYIEKIVVKNQDGKELQIVDILATDGTSIMSRADYQFPNSEEDFYIKIKYDGTGETTKIGINVDFKYLDECQASMIKYTGKIYQWGYVKKYVEPSQIHKKNCTWHPAQYDNDNNLISSGYYSHENCHYTSSYHPNAYYYQLEKAFYSSAQDLLEVEPIGDEGKFAVPVWKETSLYGEFGPIVDITMELAGLVFLDIPGEKDTTKVNGLYDEGFDKLLPDVEVTLYEEDGTLATLAEATEEEAKEESRVRTNPTLTDSNGHYEFKGLNAQKKYYVTYKINGQYLESTKYTANVQEYNTDTWNKSSMASILDADRTAYNTKFENIGSSPANYTTINNITGFGLTENKTYNIYEQSYEKAQKEADDIETLQSKITEKIRNYIDTNKKYPDNSAKTAIYQAVANENSNISEVKNKIQYIVDIEVIAKTGNHSSMQYYPVYDKFVIDNKEVTIGSVTYPAIYEGQRHINFGTMERERFDLKLAKDIYEVKVTINNKEYIYKYNGRNQEAVEVELRGSDVATYERDLRESDIQYIDYINNDQKKLRVYITYKIRITNQSDSFITGYVTGLNDFYDSDYTFLNSHVVKYNEQGIELDKTLNWNNDTTNHKLTTTDTTLSSINIGVSEYLDVFNQFEVNTDAIKRLLNENESTKENYAEIAGYKTYYTNQRAFDNGDVINQAGYVAGLVDRDSRPGDFAVTDEVKQFVNYSYTDAFKSKDGETKTKESLAIFQDDADKAPGLKLRLLTIMRELNGNVWEDATLSDVLKNENIRRGDGINNDSHPIQGMKVELIAMEEEMTGAYPYNHTNYNRVTDIYNFDEKQFKTAVTYTAADGSYQFKGYIPGDYLIRYTYGEGKTLTTDSNGKVYNGQDYKSTLYVEENHNVGDSQNPNYWYKAENDNKSDAHDNYSLRNEINTKNKTMNNYGATVLNYQASSSNADANTLAELQDRTVMFAETNKLVLEVEYAKRTSSFTENVQEYKVNNVDFGITERPRSEITLIKDIENIRIIANSGQTVFDANEKATNLSWVKPSTTPYQELHGYVQASMDENLLHGATIKILYRFTVKNTGEKDYINDDGTVNINFYNTGSPTGRLATTKAAYIVDYIENNLKFNPDSLLDSIDQNKGYNQFWTEVTNKADLNTGDNSRLVNVDVNTLNTYTTIIRATDNSPLLDALKPADKREEDGESRTTTLLLTKVLNTDNSSTDNLTYNNVAEIVKTENEVGRRSYNNKDRSEYNNDDISNTVKSIPGNYNPTSVATMTDALLQGMSDPMAEPDTDLAETVSVLPPFGAKNIIPFVIGTLLAVFVLAGGIFLIKKKVIK